MERAAEENAQAQKREMKERRRREKEGAQQERAGKSALAIIVPYRSIALT